MSAGDQVGAPPAPAQQRAKCVECQQDMIVRTPSLQFINMPEVSMLVMGHGKPDVCSNCGATFVATMQGFTQGGQLDIQWRRVDVAPTAIVAPTALQTQAIDRTKTTGLVVEG